MYENENEEMSIYLSIYLPIYLSIYLSISWLSSLSFLLSSKLSRSFRRSRAFFRNGPVPWILERPEKRAPGYLGYLLGMKLGIYRVYREYNYHLGYITGCFIICWG